MGAYFPARDSIFAISGSQIEPALETIAARYMAANPPHGMTYRAFNSRGILRGKDYRYVANLNELFPEAHDEQIVYAWAKYWTEAPVDLQADATCFGPMTVYLNGDEIFRSTIFTERYADARHRITLSMKAGWNHLVMKFRKTRAGFGGIFGTWLGKHPYYFLKPTVERAGQEGWIFTEPLDVELKKLPGPGPLGKETASPIKWLPQRNWGAAESKLGVFARLYGRKTKGSALAWTRLIAKKAGVYTLTGAHDGELCIFIDDDETYASGRSGSIAKEVDLTPGAHDVMVWSPRVHGPHWGFSLAVLGPDGNPMPLASACNIQGTSDPWMYLGPLPRRKPDLASLRNLHHVHATLNGDKTYWRIDAPKTWVRAYNDNPLFGQWNYPLGVTLYGLLRAAQAIGSADIERYVTAHMQFCIDTFNLALWDRDHYGGATAFHTLLTSIDSLDDCGSFGSALLEANRHLPLKNVRPIADYIADYISHKQARLEDGTFFRKKLMHTFHENTMWADDLYMSVPFLCRYAQLSGERRYLDDAARQFIGFKKRLYMPDKKLMSHVFDFRRDLATGVPWGRGNGWTIFSLSELLEVLPRNHRLRPQLLKFFQDLCAGYLPLQGSDGMWRQVLTHPDSYQETSCTAMFAYAFARGVRFDWLRHSKAYARAALRAWEGLAKTSIDRAGNVHGVCRGSEFSFSPAYYKSELLPRLNDTHGIGIVLLAGVEILRLEVRANVSQFRQKSTK